MKALIFFSYHRTRGPAGHHSDNVLSNIITLNSFVCFEKVLQRTVNVTRVTSHTHCEHKAGPQQWGLRPAALGHAELLGEVYTSLLFARLFRAPPLYTTQPEHRAMDYVERGRVERGSAPTIKSALEL